MGARYAATAAVPLRGLAADCSLRELLTREAEVQTPTSISASLGDGFFCTHNAVFAKVRAAALAAGFRFEPIVADAYSGWPLVSLDLVLQRRVIPYKDNRAGLAHLEALRPGFFRLRDLRLNRPSPNYLLHEAAHAVAFAHYFQRPDDAFLAMSGAGELEKVLLGESFAMTCEYLAACAISPAPAERWLHEISSYQRKARAKKTLGALLAERGGKQLSWLLLLSFLKQNHLQGVLSPREIDRALELIGAPRLPKKMRRKTAEALEKACCVDPGFLADTSRLFLGSLGYGRDVTETLKGDPLTHLERSPQLIVTSLRLLSDLNSQGAN